MGRPRPENRLTPEDLGGYGASKVYNVNGPEGLAQPVVDAMAKVIQDNDLGYALFGGGLLGFEIGAGLAARLDAGVCMEVTEVKVDGDKLVARRPILQDSQISDVHYRSDVGVIIGRLNAFAIEESGSGGTFESVILIDGATLSGPPLTSLAGRWSVEQELVLTAIVI